MYKKLIPFVMCALLVFGSPALAQNGLLSVGIEKTYAVGIVKSVGEGKLVLETRDGILMVILLKVTGYKRLQPDNLSLKAAAESRLADIAVSDRVLVTGRVSDDKTSIRTKTVYLVKNSDVQTQREKDRLEWRTRGISGRVKAVNTVTKEILVEIRRLIGTTAVKITPGESVKYLRYASDSVEYKDAVESKFEDIKMGDTIRALGDRSEDRMSLKAEQILSGAFLTVAGAVKSINAEKKEVTISDIKTKKDVTIIVNENSLLKRFPERIAKRLAMAQFAARFGGGARSTGRERGSGDSQSRRGNREGTNTGNSANSRGQTGQGRRGGARRGDINEMLNRFPSIKVTDLKIGDMIAASSPKSADPTRLTAIKLLAGVEPFLKAQQIPSRRPGGRGRGAGNIRGGFTIPGLDDDF